MTTITPHQRKKINHELKTLGFGGLDDPTIYQQIATLYATHESFRGLLMSTAPDQRRIAYEALRPHLNFKPKPLDVYESEVRDRAEREQWDVWDGTAFPKPYKVQEIETEEHRLHRLAAEAIGDRENEKLGGLELVCINCTVAEFFKAKNRKEAIKTSESAGWRTIGKKAYCPRHVPKRCTMKLECGGEYPDVMRPGETRICGVIQRIRVFNEQDGYTEARLRGWTLGVDCLCPECGQRQAKPALLQ